MKFNKFILDNYLQTEEGKKSLIFFNEFNEFITNEGIERIVDFVDQQYFQKTSKELIEDILANVNDSIKYQLEKFPEENKDINSIESAEKYFDFFIKITIENMKDLTKRQILSYITDISLVLYMLHPNYFFPYFFVDHFFKLEAIFDEFGIPMPVIPSKVKQEERLYYYIELCKSLFEFRNNNNLSVTELNILLYFFSKNLIENIDIREDKLPEPTKVYISGATKNDCTDIIEKADNNTKQLWGGNVNTLPGDIILIYGVAPFSQINSIWRAISKGFLDPFSYWFNLIWVGHMLKIPSISYQELVEDEIWGKKSIVKSHMQGISGIQCTVAEYNEIVRIARSKGFDVKRLPKIKGPQLLINVELNIERDVEIYLLEPFLHKLGFSEKDWIRQMPLRMGRGERIYPDYVIKANTKRGEETAEFIWEAKFKISNQKQLLENFFQAKSYALRLNTNGFGLVAIEGIWLSYKKDSFMFNKITNYTWEEINNSDIFNTILLKIGNKK
jgi:hypothetical protein